MHLKIILNAVHPLPGFVYTKISMTVGKQVHVGVRPRKGSKAVCSVCHRRRPGYDTLPERAFEFVPLWGLVVFLLYSMRRVNCKTCGVVVEEVPWAVGKRPITKAFAYFLASWAKRMSWTDVARAFKTSWESVFRSAEMVVTWGLANRNLDNVRSIGVDEVLWHRGRKFLTVVYQIDNGCKRLLWIGKDRTEKTLESFFDTFGAVRSSAIKFVASDMWRPYLNVIKAKAVQAIHILDRFHIMANMNKAINEVRAQEARVLKAKGLGEVLKGTRWIFLKRPTNLTTDQHVRLRDLLTYNLRAVRAYLLRESFQIFWTYSTAFWAGRFLDSWCSKVMRSKIEPMKKLARTLRAHRSLILNWFDAKGAFSQGAVEGLNNKLKLITRRAFGLRTLRATEVALYHALGDLPDPAHLATHRFC